MSQAKSSGADSKGTTESGEDDLASLPKPPPLPRERMAQAKKKSESPAVEPPPLPSPVGNPTVASSTDPPPLPQSVEPPPLPQSAAPPPLPRSAAPPPIPQPAPPPQSQPATPQPQAQSASPPSLAPQATPSQPPQHSARRKGNWVLYGLVLLVVLSLGAAVLFLGKGTEEDDEERQEPVAEQNATGSPTDLVDGGKLLLDAKPWGELTALVDSESQEIELPTDRQTPLVLSLAPGDYTVFMTHPELKGQEISCEVEVWAHIGAMCRLDLVTVTTEEYWEDAGWRQ